MTCIEDFNGSVFVCLLDASKAFDRVNLKQLGARGVPGYILRILIYWYKNKVCSREYYTAKVEYVFVGCETHSLSYLLFTYVYSTTHLPLLN